jgi:hypothetical protein
METLEKSFFVLVFAFLSCLPLRDALASNDTISRDGAVESVKIGDSAKKIFSTFESRYQVIDVTKPQCARAITLSRDKNTIATFSIDGDGRIFLIDIRGVFRTVENIGHGSTLAEAINLYGGGSVTPTDQGYLVTFEKMKNISFLLSNDDIPKDLRNIPDDVFTPDQEKRILGLGKARIIAIQISHEY